MGRFSYKAKEGPRKTVSGEIEAESLEQAVARIVARGYVPLDVRPALKPSRKKDVVLGKGIENVFQGIPGAIRVLFFRQMADLIQAGVPVLRSMNLVVNQTRHRRFREICGKMARVIQDGGTLSQAMARFPEAFKTLQINLVRAGEVGGNLGEVLGRLADLLEKDQEQRSRVLTALTYPAFILVAGAGVLFVLLTWVIPEMSVIFEDMADSLPWITKALLSLSAFFEKAGLLLIFLFLTAVLLLVRFCSTPDGRLWFDRLKLRLPLVGRVVRDSQISRFARMLGTLIENGVEVLKALETVTGVMDNVVYQHELQVITQKVAGGDSLSQSLKASALFPETVVSMVQIGESTGHFPQGLFRAALYFERKNEQLMKRMTTMLEPALILVIGLIVGFVVMALLLPIFNMNLMVQ